MKGPTASKNERAGREGARHRKLGEKELAALEPEPGSPQTLYWAEGGPAGFGVLVGAGGTKTFVWRGRRDGRKVFVTIGRWRAKRSDGHEWTVVLARKKAHEIVGSNVAPERGAVPTLEAGLAMHVARLRKRRSYSERTVRLMETEVRRYLAKYLKRPITEVTGPVLEALHDSIKAGARVRAGSNPLNPKGAPLANRVIAHYSAIWRTTNKKLHGRLGNWNPAGSVDRDFLKPKRELVEDTMTLSEWYAQVQEFAPIRRDLQIFALFTGMRSAAARSVRWEHVDFSRGALQVPRPKGGEARAFSIPLAPSIVEMLRQRQRDNPAEVAKMLRVDSADDQGWVFPSRDKRGKVIHVRDPNQYVRGSKRKKIVPGMHPLRRSYETAAHQAGVGELDLHVLTNHAFGSHNVNATYIKQHWDHLAQCQERVAEALWARIRGER